MKRNTAIKQEDWQVQTAKARFSELFRKARTEGPQRVTKLGKEAVVILSEEEYDKLKRQKPVAKKKTLWQIFRESPFVGLEMEFERDKSPMRDVEL